MTTRHPGVRTRDELVALIREYLDVTGMVPTKLGAYALGDNSAINKILARPDRRILIDTMDRILTFMDQHPSGLQ